MNSGIGDFGFSRKERKGCGEILIRIPRRSWGGVVKDDALAGVRHRENLGLKGRNPGD